MRNLIGRIARFARFEVLTVIRFVRRFGTVRRLPVLHESSDTTVEWLADHLTNPSITETTGGPVIAARLPTYRLSRLQRSMVRIAGRDRTSTILLVPPAGGLSSSSMHELVPTEAVFPKHARSREYEDARIFEWRGSLWGLWTESTPLSNGYCYNAMVLGRFERHRVVELISLRSPRGRDREKNWMPLVDGDRLFFMYNLQTLEMYELTDGALRLVSPQAEPIRELVGQSGSSQFVPFEGGWLGVSHRGLIRPVALPWLPFGYYSHRFVALNGDFTLRAVSAPFFFLRRDVEFCAGLSVKDGVAVMSVGAADARGAIIRLPSTMIRSMLAIAS